MSQPKGVPPAGCLDRDYASVFPQPIEAGVPWLYEKKNRVKKDERGTQMAGSEEAH